MRIAMASGTNKWASRAVVILQLAAWSAVGVVLLQKGVSSLQKGTDKRNVTQQMMIPVMTVMEFNRNSADKDRSRVSVFDETPKYSPKMRWNDNLPVNNDQSLSDDELGHHVNSSNLDEIINDPVLEGLEALINEKPTDKFYELKKADRRTNQVGAEEHKNLEILMTANLTNRTNPSEKSLELPEKTEENPASEDSLMDIKSPASSTTRTPGIWETRRRLRLSHLSGGGAAAAVAMVAVGAVMLVLGPAVIVLRALDERRQERRFLKLSGRDDLPPTYEQATLMDEAPRYSTLSLNTILGPPPPPSPTPTRIHLV